MPSNSKPAIRQRADHQPLQIARRAGLHAGGNFFAEQFEQQIGHQRALAGGLYRPIGDSSQASQQALARARTRPI